MVAHTPHIMYVYCIHIELLVSHLQDIYGCTRFKLLNILEIYIHNVLDLIHNGYSHLSASKLLS